MAKKTKSESGLELDVAVDTAATEETKPEPILSAEDLIEQVVENQGSLSERVDSLIAMNQSLDNWRSNATAWIRSVCDLNNQGRIVLSADQVEKAKQLLSE